MQFLIYLCDCAARDDYWRSIAEWGTQYKSHPNSATEYVLKKLVDNLACKVNHSHIGIV